MLTSASASHAYSEVTSVLTKTTPCPRSFRYLPKRPHVPGHFGTYQNGHPKSSRNGSRMVDMRNRDWEMDRTGPTDHFRPFQTPPNPPKTSKNSKIGQIGPKNQQKSQKKPSLYPPLRGAPIVTITMWIW